MKKIIFAAWINLVLVSVFIFMDKYELAMIHAILCHGFMGLLKNEVK